jgi:dCMP deaminase
VKQWSKDPKTQVGAVVVGDNPRNLTVGYNGFPPGIADTPERLEDRQTKYKFMVHAERAALDNATFDTRGGILASTMFPCVECTKSIISKGIHCVVCPPRPEPIGEPSWRDELPLSEEMLKEAGIRIIHLEPET